MLMEQKMMCLPQQIKIFEKSPIIIQENKSGLPSPQMVSTI